MADKKEKEPLTPMDIHNKEFKRRGRNGYDRFEVDSFLDQIVDDYGDSLDQIVDLKNERVNLDQEIEQMKADNQNLQSKLKQFEEQETEVAEIIGSAQKSATQIKKEAQGKAAEIINNAKMQAKTDTKFELQQKDTLNSDYNRLKKEIAEFRNNIQKMLQAQIDNLNDDQWQKALDKYFNLNRFYPEDGTEPLTTTNDSDNIDKQATNALESSQEQKLDNVPSNADLGTDQDQVEDKQSNDQGPRIIFPDDYKEN